MADPLLTLWRIEVSCRRFRFLRFQESVAWIVWGEANEVEHRCREGAGKQSDCGPQEKVLVGEKSHQDPAKREDDQQYNAARHPPTRARILPRLAQGLRSLEPSPNHNWHQDGENAAKDDTGPDQHELLAIHGVTLEQDANIVTRDASSTGALEDPPQGSTDVSVTQIDRRVALSGSPSTSPEVDDAGDEVAGESDADDDQTDSPWIGEVC
ncbi:hypothetical protein [Microbacterium sp. P03]|uniref:hypothetical protein n=1 Tax=Microbacterium sp. P03 TaxID=3366946 RepID=UPI003745DB3E